MERQTILEWDKHQSRANRLALGIDADGDLWLAERKGDQVELSQPEKGTSQMVEAPLADPDNPGASLPRLVGPELLASRPDGLWLGGHRLLAGRFDCYDGARHGDSWVVLASGEPESLEPGTYWIRPASGDIAFRIERLSDRSNGVSVFHDADRIGLAWSDEKGVHTLASSLHSQDSVLAGLISYYSGQDEQYRSPSVVVDQTGKAYALFYLFSRTDGGPWTPTREMQLNFERIAFKASATEDGHDPINLIHRKRIYMVYGLKPEASTARWRVPGTTMWDGAEHIPGSYPQAVTNGKTIYIATNKGLWSMGTGQTDEGLDLLSQSWASPEGDEGPRNTFGARLRRWFGF